MILTICVEAKAVEWVVQHLELPIETPLTPRIARDAINAVFPGVRDGIVWHKLVGYRLYKNTWKSIRRLTTNGKAWEYYVGSNVEPEGYMNRKRTVAKGKS